MVISLHLRLFRPTRTREKGGRGGGGRGRGRGRDGRRGRSRWKKERDIIAGHECGSESLDTTMVEYFAFGSGKVTATGPGR